MKILKFVFIAKFAPKYFSYSVKVTYEQNSPLLILIQFHL